MSSVDGILFPYLPKDKHARNRRNADNTAGLGYTDDKSGGMTVTSPGYFAEVDGHVYPRKASPSRAGQVVTPMKKIKARRGKVAYKQDQPDEQYTVAARGKETYARYYGVN